MLYSSPPSVMPPMTAYPRYDASPPPPAAIQPTPIFVTDPTGQSSQQNPPALPSPVQGPTPALTVNDIQPESFIDVATGETIFPCPHCPKQYRGKHARSIWRRHLADKHDIPLATQPRKTRWDNVVDRPKDDEERRQRTLESKRRWAKKNREAQKAKKLGLDPNVYTVVATPIESLGPSPSPSPGPMEQNMSYGPSPIASTSQLQPQYLAQPMYPSFLSVGHPPPQSHHPPLLQRSLSTPLNVPYTPHLFADQNMPPPSYQHDPNQYRHLPPLPQPMSHNGNDAHLYPPPDAHMQWAPLPSLLAPPQLGGHSMQRASSAPGHFASAPLLERPIPQRSVSVESRVSEPAESVAMNLLLLKTGNSSNPNSPERPMHGPRSCTSDASNSTLLTVDLLEEKKRRWSEDDGSTPPTTPEHDERLSDGEPVKRLRLSEGIPDQPPSSPPLTYEHIAPAPQDVEASMMGMTPRKPFSLEPPFSSLKTNFSFMSSPSQPGASAELGLAEQRAHKMQAPTQPPSSPSTFKASGWPGL